MNIPTYKIYKGLQRPLVFKIFKGKYIYWALGSIVAGVVAGGAASMIISSIAGAVTMVLVAIPLLFFTISKQKEGLYTKTKEDCIYMIGKRRDSKIDF
ncbi:MAG TPA: DUF4133 domain-containing protein [Chryseobacterium sp.]|nr:DUF4133 domain-containing protein [Chryseobacterium sp.]